MALQRQEVLNCSAGRGTRASLSARHKQTRGASLKGLHLAQFTAANFLLGSGINSESTIVNKFEYINNKVLGHLIHLCYCRPLLMPWNSCQRLEGPAGVETADVLQVLNKTTVGESDDHSLTPLVQWKIVCVSVCVWRGDANFNNKPVNSPIWIPRSPNCLNPLPLAIAINTHTPERRHHIYQSQPLRAPSLFVPLYPQHGLKWAPASTIWEWSNVVGLKVCMTVHKCVPSVASLSAWICRRDSQTALFVCFCRCNLQLRFDVRLRASAVIPGGLWEPELHATFWERGKIESHGTHASLHLIITMLNLYWLL